ncbi:hypothetical protein BGZ94_009129, partial [Podila epigama]
ISRSLPVKAEPPRVGPVKAEQSKSSRPNPKSKPHKTRSKPPRTIQARKPGK